MKKYIVYEVKNALGNIFTIIFGFIFPALMTIIFYAAFGANLEGVARENFVISMFFTNMMIAPLAIVYIGFSALFSQEIERDVTLRMTLFGYDKSKQLKAKFAAQFIVLLVSLILYAVITLPVLNVPSITFLGLIYVIVLITLISLIFYMIAFSIATLSKKFSVSFGITMSTYFLILILSGMMGIKSDQLPAGLKHISVILPTTHVANHAVDLWNNENFNALPLILSFVGFILISGCMTFYAIKKNR